MMGKKKVSLIVTDIEGCLSNAKGMPLDLLTLNLIQAYNLSAKEEKSPPITLCSGRPQPFIEAFAQMLAVTSICICENGAAIYNPETDQYQLHPDITKKHVREAEKLRQRLAQEISKYIPHKIEPGKEICISLNPVTTPDNYAQEVEALYQKLLPLTDPDLFQITHSASAVDITPQGIDKGAGLDFLCDMMHIQTDQILGIGDTTGDLPFLCKVGRVGVPDNAQDRLKELADFFSKKSGAKGVQDIIRHFVSK